MDNLITDKLKITNPTKKVDGRAFSSPLWTWWTCRDRFHEYYDKLIHSSLMQGKTEEAMFNAKFFYQMGMPVEAFAFGINHAENILGLYNRSKIRLTDQDGIIQFIPNEFWATSTVRFSFLTVLVRAIPLMMIDKGIILVQPDKSMKMCENWQEETVKYWDRIHQHDYFATTTSKSVAFMQGQTFSIVTYPKCGWLNACQAGLVLHDPRKFDHQSYLKQLALIEVIAKSHQSPEINSNPKLYAETMGAYSARRC